LTEEKYMVSIEIDFDVSFKNKATVKDSIKGKGGSGETSEDQKDLNDYTEALKSGNVDKIHAMGQQQFGNIKKIAGDPFQFITAALLKKFGKFARAGIWGAIALLAVEVTKWAIDEMMKPGRPLDRRFRRKAQDEIFLFNERKEQQELRQGFKEVRVTTVQGLRGVASQGQVYGNLFTGGLDIVPGGFYDQKRSNPEPSVNSNAGGGNLRTNRPTRYS
jgi:hypothetical protein